MDKQFNELFSARLAELTADLRFFHKPTGGLRPPQIFETMLPEKDRQHLEDDIFPLLCWTHYSGELTHLEASSFKIAIDGCIRVDDTVGTSVEQIAAGSAAINDLLFALHGLAAQRKIGRYKLQLPFEYALGYSPKRMGKGNEGDQPHPYYVLRLDLSFIRLINTRRK